MASDDAARKLLEEVMFPAGVYLVDDGQPQGFGFIVIDDCRGFLPPWEWPGRFRLRKGGILDSGGTLHLFDGEVGYRRPPPILAALANAVALGSRLFVLIHGRCTYGPRIVERRQLTLEDYKAHLRDVIFERDEETGEFGDYVEVTDRKLDLCEDFERMVEVVRWHILTDGGKVELAPGSKYYGRTPAGATGRW